jgi:hypothetical protein
VACVACSVSNPQAVQKRLPVFKGLPQLGHNAGAAATLTPHLLQKPAPSGKGAPHCGQFML